MKQVSRQVPEFRQISFSDRSTRFCLCIPVINEGERILAQLRDMDAVAVQSIADVVICDGGSTDGSMEPDRLRSLGVNTLLVKLGGGKLSAQLRMGFAWALQMGYDGVITMDGNGKDSIQSIPLFLQGLQEGYDFIQGSRYMDGGTAVNTPWSRHFAVRLVHAPLISRASGFNYTDTTNGFRAHSRKYLEHAQVQPFRDVFNTYELLAYLSVRAPQLGLSVKEIPVTRAYPPHGKMPTKISFLRGNLLLLGILLKTVMGKYHPSY